LDLTALPMRENVIQIDYIYVKRLINSDPAAFKHIYNLYSEDLIGFLFKVLKSRKDAEEVLQDTFTKLWETRYNIDPEKQIRSYIFTIALNFARISLRKRKYNYNYIEYLKNVEKEEYSFQPEQDEFKILYNKALSKLPPERKKIYMLCRHENLSHKEIATQMNISTKTVENQMTKALKFLHTFLHHYKDIAF
jgi:RNA polymerase sigma-70 factor, ECF subfamily